MRESEAEIAISDRAGYGGVRNEWLDHLVLEEHKQ
jgi:hypothetical protein